MNQLKFLIIAIPSFVASFITIDFLHYLYKSINPHPQPTSNGNPLVQEAVLLCQRLMDAEREAFQAYLKSPDVETLKLWKERIVQLRQLYLKADLRYKRRLEKYA
ncbi:MAG: hypothetical protein J7641_23055 [Cyanobacteria bacterium SID2]|nr:hypothetical protein [Cyanobacteria bacterium SID2]MBP0003942.1 hypothetical protein [Cyanobacteria bacterium SBC]